MSSSPYSAQKIKTEKKKVNGSDKEGSMLCNGAELNLLTFPRETAVVKVIMTAVFPLCSYMTASHQWPPIIACLERDPQLCTQPVPFTVSLSHSQSRFECTAQMLPPLCHKPENWEEKKRKKEERKKKRYRKEKCEDSFPKCSTAGATTHHATAISPPLSLRDDGGAAGGVGDVGVVCSSGVCSCGCLFSSAVSPCLCVSICSSLATDAATSWSKW